MDNTSILAIIISFLIVAVAIISLTRKKGEKTEPDYRIFFTLGIVWLPIGIATNNPALLGLGAILLLA
ncbi:MAG: hypothetical protein L3J16_03910, partial [Anaerolineales bacterium]|nr:hypothetical protein [Anaerolineales bacterium]